MSPALPSVNAVCVIRGGDIPTNVARDVQELREKEKRLDKLIEMCLWQVQSMYEDEDGHRYPFEWNAYDYRFFCHVLYGRTSTLPHVDDIP